MEKGKKGSEKYLSLWWYACLAIILTGVVINTLRFQYVLDVSSLDAEILSNRVLNCIVRNGELVFEPSSLNNLDIFSLCNIKFREGKDYFIGIEIYNFSECKEVIGENDEKNLECPLFIEPLYNISKKPKIDLFDRCVNLEGVQTSYMPSCSYKNVYTLRNNERYLLRIIGGTSER